MASSSSASTSQILPPGLAASSQSQPTQAPVVAPSIQIQTPARTHTSASHIQSIRTTRGLSHLVRIDDPTDPAPVHVLATTRPQSEEEARTVSPYTPSSSSGHGHESDEAEEKDEDDESDTSSVRISEKRRSRSATATPIGNRTTVDDGPEPKTLARILFLYGFFMPLFWFIGSTILFLDLSYHQSPEEQAEDPRTDAERKADLAVLRRAEVKWAWRSFIAAIALVVIIMVVVLVWMTATGKFGKIQY